MKNILVGIDLESDSDLLFEKAVQLAKAFSAKLWFVHIAAPEPDFVGYEVGPQYIRDFRAKELKEEHKLLTKMVDKAEQKGIEADGMLIPGNTVEVVLKEADKLKIELIIFGHEERSSLYSAFFGSNSVELVKKSNIPVWVVPYTK